MEFGQARAADGSISASRCARAASSRRLEPLRHVDAGVLNIAYYEEGPADGPVVMLMHGFPYDIHSYVDVAPMLAAKGCRVIVPYLRGYGPTRFLDAKTPRSGEQAAIGADLIALMDALGIKRAVVRRLRLGRPRGLRRRGAVAGPLRRTCDRERLSDPEHRATRWSRQRRCMRWRTGISIISRSSAAAPGLPPTGARSPRYCGGNGRRTGISTMRTFDRTAVAFDNPDYVDVVIHSYRHRYGLAEGDPRYADLQRRLAAQPVDHGADHHAGRRRRWRAAPTDGTADAAKFSRRLAHRIVPHAGHNLPQEEPEAFAASGDGTGQGVRPERGGLVSPRAELPGRRQNGRGHHSGDECGHRK